MHASQTVDHDIALGYHTSPTDIELFAVMIVMLAFVFEALIKHWIRETWRGRGLL